MAAASASRRSILSPAIRSTRPTWSSPDDLDARHAPRADAMVTACRASRSASHRRLRPGAVRRRRGRSSAPRMPADAARSPASSRRPSRRWKLGAAARADRGGDRADDPPAELRGRRRIRGHASWRPTPRTTRFFAPAPRDGHACSTCPAISRRGSSAPAQKRRGPRPLHLCRPGAVLLLPPRHPSRRAGLRPSRQCDCAMKKAVDRRAFGGTQAVQQAVLKLGGKTARAGWGVSG